MSSTILLILAFTLGCRNVFGLPELPSSLKADSELLYLSDELAQYYKVEEYIDRQDGSIKLSVSNLTDDDDKQRLIILDYYRFKEHVTSPHDGFDNKVILYDRQPGLCGINYTNTWSLRDYSHVLSELFSSNRLDTTKIQSDRTSIGPMTLIQIIYDNSALFKLDSRAFDEISLVDCFYFSFRFDLPAESEHKEASIIVAIPVDHVENDQHFLGANTTSLADVRSRYHIVRAGVIFFDQQNDDNKLQVSSDLIGFSDSRNLTKLIIFYTLIQELSQSKHVGTSSAAGLGELTSVNSIFGLPAGAGCGLASQHQPFHVSAHQFSGQFEAMDFGGEYFMAFDQETRHLRYDSLGDHRIVYSLDQKRATMIADLTGNLSSNFIPLTHRDDLTHDQSHCVQSYFTGRDETIENGLFDGKTMATVLGLGLDVGLYYLGSSTLPGGDQTSLNSARYHVFEREINFEQIPTIVKMHTRLNSKLSNRFFLIFYMASEQMDELDIFSSQSDAYKSMWIKRIELNSMNKLYEYRLINSRLTFTQFSWSLDSSPSMDLQDVRHSRSQLNPTRLFDTIECKPVAQQLQLELVLSQMNDSDWLARRSLDRASNIFDDGTGNELSFSLHSSQLETFSESIMKFLARKTQLARSFINDFELDLMNQPSGGGEQFLVKAKLTSPMNYEYGRHFLGWIKEFESVRHQKLVSLIKAQASMTRHECSLSLAAKYNDLKEHLYLLYCPNVGCGQLDVENMTLLAGDLQVDRGYNFFSPPIDVYYHLCEVYELKRSIDTSRSEINNIYNIDSIKKSLDKARLSIELWTSHPDLTVDQLKTYKAIVSGISLTRGVNPDHWDDLLIQNTCFRPTTRPIVGDIEHIKIVGLQLDKHHSRIHCHKACLLYAFCETYSYNEATRSCSLSNIPRDVIMTDEMALEDSTAVLEDLDIVIDCNLYALNSMLLYEQRGDVVRWDTAGYLLERDRHLLKLSLKQCAQLCHSNEIMPPKPGDDNTRNHCRSFKYLAEKSLCSLEASDHQTYYANTGIDLKVPNSSTEHDKYLHIKTEDDLKRVLVRRGADDQETEKELEKRHMINSYNRDFSQYFVLKKATRLELSEPMGTAAHETARGQVLHGLHLDVCLRECSVVDMSCVTVDYCDLMDKNTGLTRTCRLYSIRSPFSVFGDQRIGWEKLNKADQTSLFNGLPLTELESKFYVSGQSDEHNVTVRHINCRHFYMDGDHLYLKRLLASQVSQSERNWTDDQVIKEMIAEDQAESQRSLKLMEQFRYKLEDIYGDHSHSHLIKWSLQLTFGLLVGSLMFVAQPRLFNHFSSLASSLSGLVRATGNHLATRRRRRGGRSGSQLEFNEMVDIGIDDSA